MYNILMEVIAGFAYGILCVILFFAIMALIILILWVIGTVFRFNPRI